MGPFSPLDLSGDILIVAAMFGIYFYYTLRFKRSRKK
jgi:hypothetical protein